MLIVLCSRQSNGPLLPWWYSAASSGQRIAFPPIYPIRSTLDEPSGPKDEPRLESADGFDAFSCGGFGADSGSDLAERKRWREVFHVE